MQVRAWSFSQDQNQCVSINNEKKRSQKFRSLKNPVDCVIVDDKSLSETRKFCSALKLLSILVANTIFMTWPKKKTWAFFNNYYPPFILLPRFFRHFGFSHRIWQASKGSCKKSHPKKKTGRAWKTLSKCIFYDDSLLFSLISTARNTLAMFISWIVFAVALHTRRLQCISCHFGVWISWKLHQTITPHMRNSFE